MSGEQKHPEGFDQAVEVLRDARRRCDYIPDGHHCHCGWRQESSSTGDRGGYIAWETHVAEVQAAAMSAARMETPCPDCGGRGEIEGDSTDELGVSERTTERCSTCHGKGSIPSDTPLIVMGSELEFAGRYDEDGVDGPCMYWGGTGDLFRVRARIEEEK